MKYDRAFLEDIMNNKPYGYGKKILTGKLKTFVYTAKPYKKVYSDPIRIEVQVARESQAFEAARQKFYKEFPEHWREGSVEFYKGV